MAEKRFVENISKIQEKAKCHNERAVLRVRARKEEERKDRDDLASQLEVKMTRSSVQREAAWEKARKYNEKVQQKLELHNKEQCEGKESLMFKIEEKLQNATTRRENMIEHVKTTAAQSAAPRSASASGQENQ